MANVKLIHKASGRKIEVPAESAQPYKDLGWVQDRPASGGSTSGDDGKQTAAEKKKAEADKKAEAEKAAAEKDAADKK